MKTIHPVRIGTEVFGAEFQHRPGAWQRSLGANYPLHQYQKQAVCLCMGRGEKRLTIKKHPSGEYGLAKFPNTGHEHAANCVFHKESPALSGAQVYESALAESDDGMLSVRLELGLREKQPVLSGGADRGPRTGGSTQRGRMTLLGLLHLLWQGAELNQWWPRMRGKRNGLAVCRWVSEAASSIRCGKDMLSDHLLIGVDKDDRRGVEVSERLMVDAVSRGHRLLCLLPLVKYTPQAEVDMANRLRGFPFNGLPWLNMPDGLWAGALRRFRLVHAHWKAGGTVVALAQLELRAGKLRPQATVVSLALMAVSSEWIPVESSHELAVCDRLVGEGRSFVKPLRYDADQDVVFPDFILRDAGDDRGTPMEVFGRSDAAYKARSADKARYYEENFCAGGWWCWDAASGEAMPGFPRIRRP